MSKIPSPHPVVAAPDTPEISSRSVGSLREELVATPSVEEQRNGESVNGGSPTVSVREEPSEAGQDDLNTASEEQLSIKDDSQPNSSASTPRSPTRVKIIPSPLDIASGSESLSRNVSPLARETVKVSSLKAGGSSPGMPTPQTPPALSRLTSSTDSPQSPFFIPTNPFLMHVEKMPKFQWSMQHFDLLESLFKSIQEIIHKWKRYVATY